jgi:hypothetical protein
MSWIWLPSDDSVLLASLLLLDLRAPAATRRIKRSEDIALQAKDIPVPSAPPLYRFSLRNH